MSSAMPGTSDRKGARRPGRKAATLRPESNTSVTAGEWVVKISTHKLCMKRHRFYLHSVHREIQILLTFEYVEIKIWHRLMKREPVRLGDQSLQKCFMAVLFKIRSANVFLVFIFTANWVL